MSYVNSVEQSRSVEVCRGCVEGVSSFMSRLSRPGLCLSALQSKNCAARSLVRAAADRIPTKYRTHMAHKKLRIMFRECLCVVIHAVFGFRHSSLHISVRSRSCCAPLMIAHIKLPVTVPAARGCSPPDLALCSAVTHRTAQLTPPSSSRAAASAAAAAAVASSRRFRFQETACAMFR